MSGGGSKKGERRGGRKPGKPNKATVERALVAEREMAANNAKAKTFKLGKEVLRDFMEAFATLAAYHQPKRVVDKEGKESLSGNLEEFGRWGELAVKCAVALTPYESPRLNALTVVPPPPEKEEVEKVIEVKVFEADGTPGKVIQLIPPPRKVG